MTYLDTPDPHEIIDAENVIERYVLGKLDERQQIELEDHFADCARCLEAVELAQELRQGLADDRARLGSDSAGTSEPAGDLIAFPSPSSPWRSPAAWLPAAAVLLISLLPSVFLFHSRNRLQQQVEQLQQPWVSVPDAVLEIQRQATTEPSSTEPSTTATLAFRPGSSWITVALELGPATLQTDARAGMWLDLKLSAQGEQIWTRTGVSPPDQGRLLLSLPGSLIVEGDPFQIDASYRFSERPEACRAPCEGDRIEPIGSFRFAVSKTRRAETEPPPK